MSKAEAPQLVFQYSVLGIQSYISAGPRDADAQSSHWGVDLRAP